MLKNDFYYILLVKMSSVCDVHVEYIRQCNYQNLRQWMLDPNNVYVARRGVILLDSRRFPEENSIWANPYKVEKDGDLTQVLNKYWHHLDNLLKTNPNMMEELGKLKGKNLGCWCVKKSYLDTRLPETCVCHAQILAYFVNYLFP